MIIFNWKEDMVENMLFILLVLFNSESVLCVLQLSCIFVPKIYLQFTKVRIDCFRFTHGWDYKNVDIDTVWKKRLSDYFKETFLRWCYPIELYRRKSNISWYFFELLKTFFIRTFRAWSQWKKILPSVLSGKDLTYGRIF